MGTQRMRIQRSGEPFLGYTRLPYVQYRRQGLSATRITTTLVGALPLVVHPEVEMVWVRQGQNTYEIAGQVWVVRPRRFLVFWGGVPHGFVEVGSSDFISVHVPLALLLEWALPGSFARRLIAGECFADEHGDRIQERRDDAAVLRWFADLTTGSAHDLAAVQLEVHARLHRLATAFTGRPAAMPSAAFHRNRGKLAQAVAYIGAHYLEEMRVSDVAASVGVSAKHLLHSFNAGCGITLWQYVRRLRLAHAQVLLADSQRSLLEVALDSGFGSVTQFYDTFHNLCGMSPGHYRDLAQRSAGMEGAGSHFSETGAHISGKTGPLTASRIGP